LHSINMPQQHCNVLHFGNKLTGSRILYGIKFQIVRSVTNNYARWQSFAAVLAKSFQLYSLDNTVIIIPKSRTKFWCLKVQLQPSSCQMKMIYFCKLESCYCSCTIVAILRNKQST